MFKSASWYTACPFQPGVNIRVARAAPGSTFPSLSVPGSDHDSTSPGACSRPVLRPWKQSPSPDARRGRQGRTSPGQVRAGAPAGAAVRSQQLLAEAPRGCAGCQPRAGSGRLALRPDTAHPASRLLSSASPRDATGAKTEGCPRPGRARPAAALTREEAPANPAPALSPRLTPPAGRGRCRADRVCPCGRLGPERRGRDGGHQATAARGAAPGPRRGMAAGKGDTPSHWLPAVRDRSLSEPKSILSLNNTRWPTRRHARHVTPRAAPPPVPPTAPPRSLPALQLPTTSFLSPAARPSSRARPFLRPGCEAGRGRSLERRRRALRPEAASPTRPTVELVSRIGA